MGTKTKLTLLVGLMILSVTSSALADKLCIQTTVNKKTFKATNKSVVAATCPKGYTELADTSRFQGATGAQGAAGIVNLGACRTTGGTCNHPAGVNTCTVDCNNGEFVLQYTTSAMSDFCLVSQGSGSYSLTYSNGLGAGIKFFTSSSCSYQAIVTVLCCPTS